MLIALESRTESPYHLSSESHISSNMAKCYFPFGWSGGHVYFCFRPSISNPCQCALAKKPKNKNKRKTQKTLYWHQMDCSLINSSSFKHEILLYMSIWHFVELEFCLLWVFFNSLPTWSPKQNSRNNYHPQTCLFQIQKKGKQNRCP